MRLPPDFSEFLSLLNSAQVEYLLLGGDAPVALQSMTSTYTHDVDATLAQSYNSRRSAGVRPRGRQQGRDGRPT